MTSNNCVKRLAKQQTFHTPWRPPYICRSCRQHAQDTALRATTPMQPIACRNASSSSFTDRLRKRIWGTDEPLGQKDPYGGPGIIERRRQEQELRKGTSASTSPNQQETATYEYDLDDVPEESNATTWEGMPVVGGPDWGIDIWEEENPFEGFDGTVI